jgi:very-short-patch-repair endonuclease
VILRTHLRLIIEYDGRQHAEDKRQWLTDIFRREELDQMHWRLVIITAEGIYREPLRTLERVRDALLECGAVGVCRTYKPEWRLHFPGR